MTDNYEIEDRRIVEIRRPVAVGSLGLEAFSVIHSLHTPVVGHRITGGRVAIFYVSDVVDIEDRAQALHGIRIFVGDGA